MPDENRHELSPENVCDILGVPKGQKYPFRLVYFRPKEGAEDIYVAQMTEASWPDMGFAIRGFYPIVQEVLGSEWNPPRNRREGFFGIINAQEELQPHEFNYDDINGIEVCYVDEANNIEFMVKGNLLRLPIKPLFPPPPPCACNCGARYGLGMTLSPSGSVPSEMLNPYFNKVFNSFPAAWWSGATQSFAYKINSRPYWPYLDYEMLKFVSAVIVGIISPQYTAWCPIHEPPVFNHPYCSGYEMAVWKTVSWSYYYATREYHKPTTLLDPITIWEKENLTEPKTGGQVGWGCYYPTYRLEVSDLNVGSWSGSTEFNLPPLPTRDDFPELEEGQPFPEFEEWNPSAVPGLGPPTTSNWLSCEEPCVCDEHPPWYDSGSC